MTKSEIISRIIFLESQITQKIISDRSFRATDQDEFKEHRTELRILREMVKDELYPPSYLPDGKNPQRPSVDLEIKKPKLDNKL